MYSTHTFRILGKRLARKLLSRGSDYRFPVLFLSCLLLPGRSTAQCTGNCFLNLYQNLSCNFHLLRTKDVSTGAGTLPIQILAQDVFARHHIAKLMLLLVQITMQPQDQLIIIIRWRCRPCLHPYQALVTAAVVCRGGWTAKVHLIKILKNGKTFVFFHHCGIKVVAVAKSLLLHRLTVHATEIYTLSNHQELQEFTGVRIISCWKDGTTVNKAIKRWDFQR